MPSERAALPGEERSLPGASAPAGRGDTGRDGSGVPAPGRGLPGRMSSRQAGRLSS